MKLLTFVIPAYNSEEFLDICIPSMLEQKTMEKIDIIVVNDGSKDGTAAAAERYCSAYPDTVRLINQDNKGHGGALNTGCAAADSKYLKVIDSDDWIVTENLSAFLHQLDVCESDVVLTHHHTVDISTDEIREWKCKSDKYGAVHTLQQVMDAWSSYSCSMTFHGITYRTAFYQQYGCPLTEHVFYEDYEYATFPCALAQSITPLDLFLYEYRIGDVNQSVSSANQLKRIGHVETVLDSMLKKYNLLPESAGKHYASAKIQELMSSYFSTALLVNPDKKEGRRLAAALMECVGKAAPEIIASIHRKYQVFLLMNRLHCSRKTLDLILSSKIYRLLRARKH